MVGRVEPRWLVEPVILAVLDRQLGEHGAPSGVRDAGALASALAQPVNRWRCGEDDHCALAAVCTLGIARNHPFVDGDKRTAWVAARLFLRLNGRTLVLSERDAVITGLALAAGELEEEEELAGWLRERLGAGA
ncbi:MAG: type II toxin-antitoxin system death-on-curing family toxin [Tsuneonella sp.]